MGREAPALRSPAASGSRWQRGADLFTELAAEKTCKHTPRRGPRTSAPAPHRPPHQKALSRSGPRPRRSLLSPGGRPLPAAVPSLARRGVARRRPSVLRKAVGRTRAEVGGGVCGAPTLSPWSQFLRDPAGRAFPVPIRAPLAPPRECGGKAGNPRGEPSPAARGLRAWGPGRDHGPAGLPVGPLCPSADQRSFGGQRGPARHPRGAR